MAELLQLVLASNNAHKRDEIAARLDEATISTEVHLDLLSTPPDPTEDGDTFAANAMIKALAWARHPETASRPALADDSGLCVAALDASPGIFSSRFAARAGRDCTGLDRDLCNNLHLLERLAGVADRAAWFHCSLALAVPRGEPIGTWLGSAELGPDFERREVGDMLVVVCSGQTHGRILDVEPEHDGRRLLHLPGGHGFGYDPLFYSDELDATFASVDGAEKNRVSHRGKAVDVLASLLARYAIDAQ